MVLVMEVFTVSMEYVHVHACVRGFGRRDGAHLSFLKGKSVVKKLMLRQQEKTQTCALAFLRSANNHPSYKMLILASQLASA